MAYSSANPPTPVGHRISTEERGAGLWLYTDSDVLADIDDTEYFSNGFALGMQVNDIVNVIDASAHSSTRHVVNAVVSGGGATIKRVGDIGPYFAFLDNFKLDSETYYDDAFQRAYSATGGDVGGNGSPRTLVLPAPAALLVATSAMTGGIRITQTIKMRSQTNLIGQGGLMTTINCREMLNVSSADDMDGIHFGSPDTWNHFGTLQHIRLNNAPRHGISTNKSAFGENTFIDNVSVNICKAGAGFYNSGFKAAKPFRLGNINCSGNKYGVWLNNGGSDFRDPFMINLISGDNNLDDLIRVQSNPGSKTTALSINHIKCEISRPDVCENVVNLRSGAGGICRIGNIYVDLILVSADHATATMRVINATEDSGAWRVDCDQWARSDNRADWDNELAYDDGTLSLTWADVNRTSLQTTLVHQYNSTWNSDWQSGVDEGIATTQVNLRNKAAGVNANRKFVGKRVFDTTNTQPVYAAAALTSSVWVDATGATLHTPV